MTRTNTRSFDAPMLRRLQIVVFTLFFLLISQTYTNAQTEDCPLCPTSGRDTLPPHLKCYASVRASLDTAGYRYISPLIPLSLLGDNCPVLTVWSSQSRFYCRDTGTRSVIIFAQDSAGNIARCTTRVTIIDTLRSKIVNCARDTTFKLSGGECSSPKFTFPTPSVKDNCAPTLTMVQKSGLPSGSAFPSGISTVVFETTNTVGAKSTCTFKVTVNELIPTAGSLLCQSALDVGIGETCQTTISARDLLSNANLHCIADYKLSINYGLAPVPNNLITAEYIGRTLKAQIVDLQTNNGCVTTLNIRDLSTPKLAAPADVEVACNQTNNTGSTATSLTGLPTVVQECSVNTTTSFNDTNLTSATCEGTFAVAPTGFPATLRFDPIKGQKASRIIVREFSVTDASGNVGKTLQAIYVRKIELAAIICPPNFTLLCNTNGVNTSPDSVLSNGILLTGTGRPVFANGNSITNGSCKIGTSFADVRTNTATGYYIVRTWTLGNTCTGETRQCQQSITVNETAPVVACKTNYSAVLDRTTSIAKIAALDMVSSLTDDCTAAANLMVRIQRLTNGMPWPDSTEVTFNCNDIGTLPVEILVKDATGLMSKCQANVQISDPNGVCRAPSQPAIFGIIETEEGKRIVSNVKLQSATNPTVWQMTRASTYSFLGMPRGDDCDLTPSRDSDLVNGVTTFDVALMSRHILDVQPIATALKQIAGDVNADGSIDALDMVITRRMVLRQMDAYPSNKSWHFVPKVYAFPSAARTVPALNYPETLAFVNLTDTFRTADFWAVKTGDLNGSANGNSVRSNGQLELRGGANPLVVNAKNAFLEKDNIYEIDISSDKMDADGFQFTLNFDKEAVKILSIEQGELLNFDHTNYALFPSEGKATVSWNGSLNGNVAPTNLFRLRLSAKQSVHLNDALRLTSDLTPAEAFSLVGGTKAVELRFKGTQNTDFTLFQNEPNPTSGGTTNIRFRLPDACETKLTLYDVSGKILQSTTRSFEKGENTWRISTPSVSGVVLYRLDTPTHSATRRMMIGE